MKPPKKQSKALIPRANPEVLMPRPSPFDGSLEGLTRLIKGDFESVPDARRRLVELLRGEEDMKKFVRTADRVFKGNFHVSGKADSPSLDLVCERAGINRSLVFGAAARVLHRYHFDVSQIIIGSVVANRAFDVAASMADGANTPLGQADRRLFMEVAGARHKGAGGVNVQVNTSANAQAGTRVEVEQSVGKPLPVFEDGIPDMAAKLRAIPGRSERTD